MTKIPNFNLVDDDTGTVIALTVPKEDVETIARYKYNVTPADLKEFAAQTLSDFVAWMRRMTGGLERFELQTLGHWYYDGSTELLKMINADRDANTVFDMSFTDGTIEDYNQGLGTILNSFWYKTHANPTAVVELIAAADLLYRKHHNGTSPAAAAGIKFADVNVDGRQKIT